MKKIIILILPFVVYLVYQVLRHRHFKLQYVHDNEAKCLDGSRAVLLIIFMNIFMHARRSTGQREWEMGEISS
jgi:hypothetical protein